MSNQLKQGTIDNFKSFNSYLQREIIALAVEDEKKQLIECLKNANKYNISGRKKYRVTGATADEIKSNFSMYDVVNMLGLSISIHNSMVCPFHNEKTPSLKIYSNGTKWKCFGCGEGGDVIKFVEKYNNVSFREAVRFLGGDVTVDIRQHETIRAIQEQNEIAEFVREEFHQRYLKVAELYQRFTRYKRIYAPANIDQPSEYWDPRFVYAVHALPELEYWLDENLNGKEVYKCNKW